MYVYIWDIIKRYWFQNNSANFMKLMPDNKQRIYEKMCVTYVISVMYKVSTMYNDSSQFPTFGYPLDQRSKCGTITVRSII